MPLLTPDNILDYAPGLPPEAVSNAVIYMAESLAYGPSGSGYDLSLTDRVEIKPLSISYEVIPTYAIADLLTVTAQHRSARIDNEWYAIESTALEISKRRIRVRWQNIMPHATRNFGRRRFYNDRPLYGETDNQLRISYKSGVDFAVETPEVHRLRAALGGIIMAQYVAAKGAAQLAGDDCGCDGADGSGSSGQTISEKSVLNGRAVIKYASPEKEAAVSVQRLQVGSSSGSINGTIDDCLAVFRQYQVRPIVG